jgi:hypothetical protein
MFLTADGLDSALEAGRLAAVAAESSSDALRVVAIRLHRPRPQ